MPIPTELNSSDVRANWARYSDTLIPKSIAGVNRTDLVTYAYQRLDEVFQLHWNDFLRTWAKSVVIESELFDLQEKCGRLGRYLHENGITKDVIKDPEILDIIHEMRALDPDPVNVKHLQQARQLVPGQ